jgi:hypothetical protein
MKKIGICWFLGLVLFCGTFFACSNKKEMEKEKGAIEKMTDQAAKDIVHKIQTPINKAREAAKQGDERVKELDQAIRK